MQPPNGVQSYEFRFSVAESKKRGENVMCFRLGDDEWFTTKLMGTALITGNADTPGRMVIECELFERPDGWLETLAPEWDGDPVRVAQVMPELNDNHYRVCYQHASQDWRLYEEGTENWVLVESIRGVIDWTWFDHIPHVHQEGAIGLVGQLPDGHLPNGQPVPHFAQAVMVPSARS